jgi:hypothetical protein
VVLSEKEILLISALKDPEKPGNTQVKTVHTYLDSNPSTSRKDLEEKCSVIKQP